MGILNKLFQGKETKLYAPVIGQAVALSQVSDKTFGDELLGKGIAIIPKDNKICAPCDGIVDTMFDTGHAVVLKGKAGEEILIHVGIDTVKLAGEHFTVHAKEGDQIKAGQLLITADIAALQAKGFDIITPMVICNTDDYKEICSYEKEHVTREDFVVGIVA